MKLIGKSGGHTLKFGGDALHNVWTPVPPDTDPEEMKEILQNQVHRAVQVCCFVILFLLFDLFYVQCGLDIQQEMDGAQLTPDIRLSVKIGVAVGHIEMFYVGGVLDRYEFVVAGPGHHEAIMCEQMCDPGDVMVSQAAWEMVSPNFEVRFRRISHVYMFVSFITSSYNTLVLRAYRYPVMMVSSQ